MNKILVYSSIGDISNFYKDWLHPDCSYAFNYYGDNPNRVKELKSIATYFTNLKGTKFNLFSKLVNDLPKFDYYVLPDDDLNLKGEDIIQMVNSMRDKQYGVASPSHSPLGRISWPIMRTQPNSEIRETEFVEMTGVIFSREEIEKFLSAYIPYRDQMVGWGVDHIIHSACRKPFAIFDNISVVNPTNEQKGIQKREIDTFLAGRSGMRMWLNVLKDSNNNFVEYKK